MNEISRKDEGEWGRIMDHLMAGGSYPEPPKNHDGPHAWREDGRCGIQFCRQGAYVEGKEVKWRGTNASK